MTFITRPISLALLLINLFILVAPYVMGVFRKALNRPANIVF